MPVEDADDEALFLRAKAEDDGEHVPSTVLEAELSGTHPVRAWREHRQISHEVLSQMSGVSTPFLRQIEGGRRVGTAKVYAALAKASLLSVDLLIPA